MTFEQLRVFIEVATQLHMTRAAERLNMTQPAVSASIAALEASCGMPFFDRVGRRIELTEAGRLFRAEAEAILDRVSRAEAVLNDISGLRRGRLRIFASQTVANYWLGTRLACYRARHPAIALSVTIANTAQCAAAVVSGDADLACVEGEVNEPLLVKVALPGDRLVLVVGAAHAWADRSPDGASGFDPARLLETAWVLREHGSGTRQAFEDRCRDLGLAPSLLRVALEFPSNEAVLSAVAAGAGATVISELVARAGLAAGDLRLVPFDLPERTFLLLRHADRYRSKAETAFVEMVRSPQGQRALPAAG
ncbi:LysR substrate-binding domain-containing protein [Aquabacter spiritensis]|uniref:LysR family transcriptional regulator n=1 Tax=Aquabacter spiritensis TaxID=933073 RepID=A0A4R3M452_9HYPH|nr:LysR substrate-binding domain-containing protein [Aquabacter spiritensis]TCT06117.1 LysR family transcriptional regulator [Aquabacter spiritensis]